MTELNIRSVFAILAIITILQGFLLSLAIFLKSSKNNGANILLAVFIAFISISMIGRAAPFFPALKDSFLLSGLMDVIIFSYGPLSFFYLKNLFEGRYYPQWKDFPHFLPLLIFLIYFFYRLFWPEHFDNSIIRENLIYVYHFLELMAIMANAFYVILGFGMVVKYQRNAADQLSFLPQVKYIKIFLVIISLIILLWILGFFTKMNPDLYFTTLISYNSIWLLISVITFLFAYFSYFDADILFIKQQKSKYEQGYFSGDYYKKLKNKLDEAMQREKPFLNPKLTLSELAKITEHNPRDLSRVINEQYKMNFYEFINSYRIGQFKKLVKEESHKNFTILSLALESGFNSKATFNSAFKKMTGQTPSEYIKHSKK